MVYKKAYGDMDYNEYINSWLWRDKREWILELQRYHNRINNGKNSNFCEECKGESKPFQVHHITYDSIGNEGLNDVIILCKACHEKKHKTKEVN